MSRSAPFPWIILLAFAVLFFAPQINEWLEHHPRVRHSRGRLRAEITRKQPGRDLERWQP